MTYPTSASTHQQLHVSNNFHPCITILVQITNWTYFNTHQQLFLIALLATFRLNAHTKGLRGIVFTLSVCVCVCLCVYLCVCVCLCVLPIFWYFISRLLEEISIWNVYRILIVLYSIKTILTFICQRSRSQGRYIYFYFFHWHLLGYSIRLNNKTETEMTSQKIRQYLTLTCKTPIPKLLFLIKSSYKFKKYGSHTTPSYSYLLLV